MMENFCIVFQMAFSAGYIKSLIFSTQEFTLIIF